MRLSSERTMRYVQIDGERERDPIPTDQAMVYLRAGSSGATASTSFFFLRPAALFRAR